MKYYVAIIQTNLNEWKPKVIIPPMTEDGTVLMDVCPRGTMEVYEFPTAKAAAAFARCSVSTIYRQHSAAMAARDAEIHQWNTALDWTALEEAAAMERMA